MEVKSCLFLLCHNWMIIFSVIASEYQQFISWVKQFIHCEERRVFSFLLWYFYWFVCSNSQYFTLFLLLLRVPSQRSYQLSFKLCWMTVVTIFKYEQDSWWNNETYASIFQINRGIKVKLSTEANALVQKWTKLPPWLESRNFGQSVTEDALCPWWRRTGLKSFWRVWWLTTTWCLLSWSRRPTSWRRVTRGLIASQVKRPALFVLWWWMDIAEWTNFSGCLIKSDSCFKSRFRWSWRWSWYWSPNWTGISWSSSKADILVLSWLFTLSLL